MKGSNMGKLPLITVLLILGMTMGQLAAAAPNQDAPGQEGPKTPSGTGIGKDEQPGFRMYVKQRPAPKKLIVKEREKVADTKLPKKIDDIKAILLETEREKNFYPELKDVVNRPKKIKSKAVKVHDTYLPVEGPRENLGSGSGGGSHIKPIKIKRKHGHNFLKSIQPVSKGDSSCESSGSNSGPWKGRHRKGGKGWDHWGGCDGWDGSDGWGGLDGGCGGFDGWDGWGGGWGGFDGRNGCDGGGGFGGWGGCFGGWGGGFGGWGGGLGGGFGGWGGGLGGGFGGWGGGLGGGFGGWGGGLGGDLGGGLGGWGGGCGGLDGGWGSGWGGSGWGGGGWGGLGGWGSGWGGGWGGLDGWGGGWGGLGGWGSGWGGGWGGFDGWGGCSGSTFRESGSSENYRSDSGGRSGRISGSCSGGISGSYSGRRTSIGRPAALKKYRPVRPKVEKDYIKINRPVVTRKTSKIPIVKVDLNPEESSCDSSDREAIITKSAVARNPVAPVQT